MAYLVDTNVIVRWLLPHDPLSSPAVTAIDTLRGRGETIYVGAQNLIELWNVATRPPTSNGLGMTPGRAAEELNRIEALFPLLDDVPAIYRHWRTHLYPHVQHGRFPSLPGDCAGGPARGRRRASRSDLARSRSSSTPFADSLPPGCNGSPGSDPPSAIPTRSPKR